jgi:hypothetical protein
MNNSAVICIVCVLLGTLVSTGTYAIPVSSRIEDYTDRSQELIDHLANLKAHAQHPLVRKLLEAVKETTEDVNVAVFVQNLLDQSQAQDVTDQAESTFGDKEAEAVLAAAKSLPPQFMILQVIQIIFTIIRTIVTLMIGFMIGRWTG